MAEGRRYSAGEGELTYGRITRQALGMLRAEFGRVAIVALVLFVPPPLLVAFLDGIRESLEVDRTLIQGLGFLIGIILATTIRLFGPVVYAGYLEEAVGSEYFRGERHRFVDVLAQLPWVRLVAAEILLIAGTTIGLTLFVIPGLIYFTFFVLVGPVIVQERLGVLAAFRRTYELSRGAWKMVFILVVVMVGIEQLVAELFHEILHHRSIVAQVGVEWIIASVLGGAVGLIEVALATELMARRPAKVSSSVEA